MKKTLLTIALLSLSTSVFASNAGQKGGHNAAMDSEEKVQVASAGQKATIVKDGGIDTEKDFKQCAK
jgi:hypothetical protein